MDIYCNIWMKGPIVRELCMELIERNKQTMILFSNITFFLHCQFTSLAKDLRQAWGLFFEVIVVEPLF